MARTKSRVLNIQLDGRTPNDVYIGRPSKWGNPFVIGRDGDRHEVIVKYRKWLKSQPKMMAMARKELKGRDLSCYCAPQECHGDVLIKIANRGK